MIAAESDAEYLALCDQDDVWLPTKLATAVDALGHFANVPALYCGRMTITNALLRPVGETRVPTRPLGVANALVENVAMGPTIVINREARALVRQVQPSGVVMHDAWLYLVVVALGVVIYDPQPYVLYRRHEGNVSATAANMKSRSKHLVKAWRQFLPERRRQAAELLDLYEAKLRSRDRALIERFVRRDANIIAASRLPVYRQNAADQLALRGILIGDAFSEAVACAWKWSGMPRSHAVDGSPPREATK